MFLILMVLCVMDTNLINKGNSYQKLSHLSNILESGIEARSHTADIKTLPTSKVFGGCDDK